MRDSALDNWLTLVFPGISGGRVFLSLLGAGVLLAALWVSPASPSAMGRADARLGAGDAASAVDLYDAIAVHSPWRLTREEARYRAAMIYAVEFRDSHEARRRLRLVLRRAEGERAAQAWETMAHLLAVEDRRPGAAARAYRKAADAAPDSSRAADRLVLAARSRAESGAARAADRLWAELAERHPERAGSAAIARAGLLLGQGDAHGALEFYEEAERVGDRYVRGVASLGVATCLERLGDLDEALAVIDSAELPGQVLEARREGMRHRQMFAAGEL